MLCDNIIHGIFIRECKTFRFYLILYRGCDEMILNIVNNKQKVRKIAQMRFIYAIVYLSIILTIIYIVNGVYCKEVVLTNYMDELSKYMCNINLFLNLLAYLSSLLYFYSTKSDDFFVISLVYLNILVNVFSFTRTEMYLNREFVYLNVFFRIVLLICSLSDNKMKDWIVKNKKKSVISLILITSMFSHIDKGLIENFIIDNVVIFNITIIVFIVFYIIITIKITQKSFLKLEPIYAFVVVSIMFLLIKRIYGMYGMIIEKIGDKSINIFMLQILTTISFLGLIIGIFYEVIRRINVSNNLEEELKVFYHLVEFNQNKSIAIYDEKGNIVYGNKKIREESGAQGGIYETFKYVEEMMDFYIGSKIKHKIHNINEALKNKKSWDEIIIIGEVNKVLRLEIEAISLYDKKYFAVSINDITEKYKSEKENRRNEQLLRNINDNIQDLIIGVDENNCINYVNDTVNKILKYDKSNIINRNIDEILYLEEIEISSGTNEIGKYKMRVNTGGCIEVEVISSFIIDGNGENTGKVLVCRDLTFRKEFQDLEEKYIHAKAFEQSKNEFFANLSHELKTPLNIIYSSIQLLDSKHGDAEEFIETYDKYKKGLRQNCYRMLRLINNLIDITKFESGYITPAFINCNIINLVEDITLSVIPYGENKNLNIIFDTEIEELMVKCDPENIERIILNLLSNAIKFTKVGGNILTAISLEDGWIKISVKDDGIGIPLSMQKLVFDRFVQADKSLNRNNEGSGIGLSIVKSLIDLHEGKLELKSDGKNGSEFIVYIPNIKLNGEDIEQNKQIEQSTYVQKTELELSDIY